MWIHHQMRLHCFIKASSYLIDPAHVVLRVGTRVLVLWSTYLKAARQDQAQTERLAEFSGPRPDPICKLHRIFPQFSKTEAQSHSVSLNLIPIDRLSATSLTSNRLCTIIMAVPAFSDIAKPSNDVRGASRAN